MHPWFQRLRQAHRDYGPMSLLLLAIRRIARRLRVPLEIYSYLLVAQPVASLAVPPRKARRFSTRLLDIDAPELALLPRPSHVIADRFAQGACCLGLFHDERFIGCAWMCLGPYQEDEVRAVFNPQPAGATAWDFDVFIAEEFRLGFAFSALWSAVNDWLASHNRRWTISRISTFNPASLRAHARLGAVPLGRLVFFTLGRLQVAAGTLRPWLHLSLGPASRPHVRLRAPALCSHGDPDVGIPEGRH